jgi:hypothetical protein
VQMQPSVAAGTVCVARGQLEQTRVRRLQRIRLSLCVWVSAACREEAGGQRRRDS